MKRQVVRERIAEEERAQCNRCGYAHGAQQDSNVHGFRKESGVIVQVPVMDDDAVADCPETVRQHQRIGKQKEQADPEERRQGDQRLISARVHEDVTGDW